MIVAAPAEPDENLGFSWREEKSSENVERVFRHRAGTWRISGSDGVDGKVEVAFS